VELLDKLRGDIRGVFVRQSVEQVAGALADPELIPARRSREDARGQRADLDRVEEGGGG
jgi:hypothetical protein